MASKTTILEALVTSDVDDAVKGFDKVGDSAKTMGADVASAGSDLDKGASRVDRAADSADNLASKSGQATGGLGALASGFALVGAEKYAVGLESAAMATDFFSGVGDISNLVLQNSAVLKAKDMAITVARSVKERAAAAATGVMTAAQWAFNAALSANPLALVVLGLIALVAAIVIAYKKSTTFRNIVDAAFGKILEVAKKLAKGVGDLVGWFKDKLPAAGRIAKTLIVNYFKLMFLGPLLLIKGLTLLVGWAKDKVPAAFGFLRDKVATVVASVRDRIATIVDKARDVATWIKVNLGAAFQTAKDKISAPIEVISGWISDLVDVVEDLIGWIGRIKFPDAPAWIKGIDVNPFSKAGAPSSGRGGGNVTTNIYVSGPIDPVTTANYLVDLLKRQGLWNGQLIVTGSGL